MSGANLSLAERNRPLRFSEFVGNAEAVNYLSKQVREDRGRSVLLHGPSGCGKSALADVYAAGLLCTAETERPCRSPKCSSCSALHYGTHLNLKTFRFGRISDEEFSDQVNADIRSESFGNGRFVVLIDRANLLSERTFEVLRSQMKRPLEGVTFILCAETRDAVPRSLLPFLYPIEVKQPGFREAIDLARALCRAENICLEGEAVEVLADFARSSYAKLALDLEVIAEDRAFAASAVLDHYMNGRAARYVDLVLRRAAFGDQLAALEEWNLPSGMKVAEISDYLTKVFDRRHGLTAGSLRWLARLTEWSGLIEEHAKIVGLRPSSFARRLLQIWDAEPGPGSAMLRRKASEFDDLFAGAFPLDATPHEIIADWTAKRRSVQHYRGIEQTVKKAPAVSRIKPIQQDETSMTLEDAKKAWDGASFMVQAFGVYLNFQLEIFHAKISGERAKKPEQLVTDFLRELRMYVERNKEDARAQLHTIYIHRRDQHGNLVTRMVAHLPPCRDDAIPWIEKFFKRDSNGETGSDAVAIDLATAGDDLQRHLQLIRGICAGLKPVKPEHQSFLRKTRVDVGRAGWETAGKPPRLSRWIDKSARAAASEDLEVLSVFDDDRANPCSGWERKEYEYRRAIVAERRQWEDAARDRADEGLSLRAAREQWRRTAGSREAGRPGFHKT